MKNIIVIKLIIVFILVVFGIVVGDGDGYLFTTNDYLDELTFGTSSYLIEKGKSKELYLPRKAIDYNTNTAWVEGKDGDGRGEFLVIKLNRMDIASVMKILPGFAMNDNLYKANNRPKDINIILFQSTDAHIEKIKNVNDIRNCKVIYDVIFHLNDVRDFQEIKLPDYSNYRHKYPGIYMALVIDSIYRGSKHNDTCISEIRFFDEKGKDIIKAKTDNIE